MSVGSQWMVCNIAFLVHLFQLGSSATPKIISTVLSYYPVVFEDNSLSKEILLLVGGFELDMQTPLYVQAGEC